MFAKLTSLVAGGSTLPFDLLDPYPTAWGQWTHYKGTLRADGSNVSVFRISAVNKDDPRLRAARNGVKRLRTLRHPNILSFKDTAEVEERGETAIYIATEDVAPLISTLRSLSLEDKQRDQYVSTGLQQIVSAVSFLNNDCKLIHGNICSSAVTVTPTLDWKLHGFDLTTEHQWPSSFGTDIPLAAVSWMVGAQYKSGELGKADWDAVREGPPWAVDAWGLGCLIQESYSNSTLSRTEDLRSTDHIPQYVLQYYQRLLASQPQRRLNPAKILEDDVLRNKVSETMIFLENLALKDASEKDSFFKRLPAILPQIPSPVARKKLLPLLANALEFSSAPSIALNTLLKIGDDMDEEERSCHVIPVLSKLFSSNDRGIRRGLLENLGSYGKNLPDALVEEQIYPAVQTGFGDANPYLRELTLKAMIVLGPKLSQKTLNQNVLKHLAKLQVDEEPAIRANTTVLLGNLAPMLSESTCKKILLNAFTRALKDPFPPARAAGVRAISATSQYYSAEDVAVRVVPLIGPLCVDGVQEVRVSAMQGLEFFFEKLKKHSLMMDEQAKAGVGDVTSTTSTGGVMSSSSSGGVGGSSLLTGLGWAVSSLAGGSSSSNNNNSIQPPALSSSAQYTNTAANNNTAQRQPPSMHQSSHNVKSVNDGWDDIDNSMDLNTTSTTTASLSAKNSSGNVQSGWEDDDDPLEDMMDAVAAEMEARKKLTNLSVGGGSNSNRNRNAVGSGIGGSRGVASGKGVQRGMKLGAKKLNSSSGNADDDFSNW